MRRSWRTEVPANSSDQQLAGQDNGGELTGAWKSLAQSKVALRHIENRLEAAPGTGVLLHSVMESKKTASSRKVSRRDGRRAEASGGVSKGRGRSHQSPEKNSSRSPLRNTTHDCNVRRSNTVEFREPLASYRESTPPMTPSQLEAPSLQSSSVVGATSPSSHPTADTLLSHLVYRRDTREAQTDRDLDSTHSSALEGTEVRYLNDRPALDTLGAAEHTAKAQQQQYLSMDSQTGPATTADSPASSSPGSASQRLENLRLRRQQQLQQLPDDKLEKLKERIRRQREHLEEAAGRSGLLGHLDRPIAGAPGGASSSTSAAPTAKVRKVAPAPPAPIYRGFNSSEMKIRTPDGKVWEEDDFHNLSREIYRDLTRQLAVSSRPGHLQQRDHRTAERSREKRPSKPVRKVHKAASDPDGKPAIGPSSWRQGQKLVKMVLGPGPSLPMEDQPHPADRLNRTGAVDRSRSNSRSEPTRRSRPGSTERPRAQSRTHSGSRSTATPPAASKDGLSADLRGILDDLHLECGEEERSRQRCREDARGGGSRRGRGGSGSRTRAPVSAWGPAPATAATSTTRASRSASPPKRQPDPAEAAQKKRHYDADSVRQYIARQQEERRRRQLEERKAQRDEADRRNQRLQELYRRQRGGAGAAKAVAVAVVASALPLDGPGGPVHKRLQETYTKLLLEEAQLGEEATQTQPPAATSTTSALLQKPMYQPSGESDKENKRLETPQSPSSSDMSLSEQPPLYRDELGVGVPSWFHPDRLSPAVRPPAASSGPMARPGDHLFSHLLRLDAGTAAGGPWPAQRPTAASADKSRSHLSRIEALKATAASLSDRIESEARKLAGEGINYGAPTAADMDVLAAPGSAQNHQDDRRWAKAVSPPVREAAAAAAASGMDDDDLAFRIQRILSAAGQSSYDGAGALPGVGNVHAARGQKEKSTGNLNSHAHAGRHLVNGLEKVERMQGFQQRQGGRVTEGKDEKGADGKTGDRHDSSGGSISEGPLLSEGSLSEGDGSPPHPSAYRLPRTADLLGAVDYCAGQRASYSPLTQFQREAEKYPALASPFAQREGSKAAWEELSKGSPLSVINIFTRNLHGPAKVADDRPDRSSAHSGGSPLDAVAYEDDFVSSRSSGGSAQSKRGVNGRSANIHYEELMRRSPYENRSADYNSHHPSLHSSRHSSGSSPLSKGSSGKKGAASDRSDGTLVEEHRSSCSPRSEALSTDSRKKGLERNSTHSQAKSPCSDGTLGGASGLSVHSLGLDGKSPVSSPGLASPAGSPPGPGSPPGTDSPGVSQGSSALVGADGGNADPGLGNGSVAAGRVKATAGAPFISPISSRAETKNTGELKYAPGVLQQRMSAELNYLESIEESVRQLGDVERLRGVSMAQQESVSLAQILKAQQQRHERDLYELKIKAEREALEAQLQLEESRQRAARAHAELQGSMVAAQQESLGGLQEATARMMSQQAEAARHTADAARHIQEMTELARSHITGALTIPATEPPISSLLDQQREQHNTFMKQLQARADTDSSRSEASGSRTRPEDALSPLDSLSYSGSLPSRRPQLSGGESSSNLTPTPTQTSTDQRVRRGEEGTEERSASSRREMKKNKKKATASSSLEEEEVHTGADDSLPSDSIPDMVDEKADSTSVATEYSLKFDDSMTEDEIEERSFRSLLPSEAHRRGTLEKKPRPHEESEEEAAVAATTNHDRTSASGPLVSLKPLEGGVAFSGGQDSFSQFTMDMVRQYMKDEEVRLQHQSSLLCLRQKALKEKTKAELAWLEHQKRRLRDKGEDDKMPPIRKKQRGLLIKLQQEQAEIRRLQEANKAARKERQLLLKQQQEIERMRTSTLRLKERLKSAGGEAPPETPTSETPASEAASPSPRLADGRVRSPSPPLSISSSETSSIMQKLKKMRSHMDEKFLTKREQQLMHRRHQAEELLEWKQRLDQEEAEVRLMEKEALAAWDRLGPAQDRQGSQDRDRRKESPDVSPVSSHHRRTDSDRECASEGDSSVHTELSGSQPPESPASAPTSSIPEALSAAASPRSPAHYTQDFSSASSPPSKRSPPARGFPSSAPSPSDGGSISTKTPLRSPSRTPSVTRTQPGDPPTTTTTSVTEPMSDQSDIESRIRALKDELRRRKSMAYQLKKEQRKRHKERLKAQEASLLKQLESYNDFIQKTKAELNKEPDMTPAAKPQIKAPTSASERSKTTSAPPHSSETGKSVKIPSDAERTPIDFPVDQDDLSSLGRSRSTSLPEELSDEDPPTVTPTPIYGSPERPTSGHRSPLYQESPARSKAVSEDPQPLVSGSGDRSLAFSQKSQVLDEADLEVRDKSESNISEYLLKLKQEERPESQQRSSVSNRAVPSKTGEHGYSPFSSLGEENHVKMANSPEVEEIVKSPVSHSSKPHSAAAHPETTEHLENSLSNDRSYTPDSIALSRKDTPVKDAESSLASADHYHDDFDSSVESSPRDDRRSSKATSPTSSARPEKSGSRDGSRSRSPLYDSQDEDEVEEDIASELSGRSRSTSDSNHSERLLDLHRDATEEKNAINSHHSPTISPSHTPTSPTRDEMPSFNIGDRVLVSSVQPGTLRFKGTTRFANGFWAGVELDKSEGSNNGTYDGVTYFKCEDRHGIFAPPDRITRLPEKFEIYVDTTEDEDSFFDDLSDTDRKKRDVDRKKSQQQGDMRKGSEDGSGKNSWPNDKEFAVETDCPGEYQKEKSRLNSANHRESAHPLPNGNSRDIILDFEDGPTTLLISDMDKIGLGKRSLKEITTLIDKKDVDTHDKSITPADISADIGDAKSQEGERKHKESLGTFADMILNNFVQDAVKHLTHIKRAKEQKIAAANQMKHFLSVEEEDYFPSVKQKDGLPFFLDSEKEELSSPELCNRPESPVLGLSGQEELAKRLAELELSRELLDELGDDHEQDWFDEDFGLSSRREQQRLKQKQEEEERLGGSVSAGVAPRGGLVAAPGGEQQIKTPPRPELPLPLPPKLPEQPAMVVPHSSVEVERLVHSAAREIWDGCKLGKEGTLTLAGVPMPKPSEEYLGQDAKGQDQEALCVRSYKQAVYDLTWEIFQEIYAEDPSAHQPQWVKPRRVSSSYFHRVKSPGDVTKVQEFIAAEVLKLYGLRKDQNQKTDWQKMLKFGRKKRDRVDHILVQELHEEEAQWVNYDEDELFVKMQLADSIFDALLKDTADVLTQIYDKRAKRASIY